MPGRYRELQWYLFGVRIGLLNWLRNGTRLGVRKTVGNILKPINSFSRFPEYHFFALGVEQFVRQHVPLRSRLVILDVGSPKPFGLYLAYRLNADVHLTDITRFNLDSDQVIWSAICGNAKGRAIFDVQDARALTYVDGKFDIVYSMSVVEHVEGERQDEVAISEMLRVLKPGGLLLLSMPCGPRYVEQFIAGRPHLNNDTHDTELSFFQRIYNSDVLKARILPTITVSADLEDINTVSRHNGGLTRAYYKIRPAAKGNGNRLLGITNPLWSMCINEHAPGARTDFLSSYDKVFSLKDIYGDFIISSRKRRT